ncbi:hypothetical protein [Streptomyces sp. HD]
MFVFLGVDDGSHPLGVTVKLRGESAHRTIAPKRLTAELDAP